MTQRKILVWDVPTRLFHWLLALSFLGALVTADSERLRALHVAAGHACVALILFRLVWGLVGTRHARFRSFLYGPREIVGYLRSVAAGSPRHYVGHNPVGGVAVVLLLGLGLATGLSGWATLNEIGGDAFEDLHEGLAVVMAAVVCVHVVGVMASSLVHRENLLVGMVTGRKQGPRGAAIGRRCVWIGAVVLLLTAAVWSTGIAGSLRVSSASASGHGESD